jgi:hypothetical protein
MATCSSSVPDLDASGDNLYGSRICRQDFVHWAWDAFDFDEGDWVNGFGFEDVCNNTMPLGRTMGAIWALTYSSPNYPRESGDSNILEWGCKFARNAIDEVDGRCGNGGAFAGTYTGAGADDRTELYLPFFYGQNVVLRAGTLLHESRHANGRDHDAGNNDSSWEYNGAWRWQVCWLAWFAIEGQFTTPALQLMARQRANNILNSRFNKPPGFNV